MSPDKLARVLGPPDGSGVEVVDAGPRWNRRPATEGVVWGRDPAPSGTAPRAAAVHALRRERALRQVRGRVTRWPPPDLGGSQFRNALRGTLLSGAVVEVGPPRERLLDAAARDAGAPGVERFRPASGGIVIARVGARGAAALLRAGAAPARIPELPLAPRLLGDGVTGGVSWTLETLLPGRRPGRVTRAMWDACLELCAALPRAETAGAVRDDFAALAAVLPALAEELAAADAAARDGLAGLGAAARHGDLWRPNLLAVRGRLTGVVDWDAWHPAAAPGVDLLNLWATERHGPGLGDAWRARPWRSPGFRAATRGYWSRLALDPAPDHLDAVALAWWAGQTAASLRRLPYLTDKGGWVESNVAAVLRSL